MFASRERTCKLPSRSHFRWHPRRHGLTRCIRPARHEAVRWKRGRVDPLRDEIDVPNKFPFKPLIGSLLSQVHPDLIAIALDLVDSPVPQSDTKRSFVLHPHPFIECLQNRRIAGGAVSVDQG